MKTILLLSALMATFLVATARLERFTPPTYIHPPTFASSSSHRFKREASPQFIHDANSFSFQPSIFDNGYGRFGASMSGQRLPTGPNNWAATGGLLGSYKLGRGTFSGSVSEPFNVPKPHPTFNVGYQHNFLKTDNPLQLGAGITGLKTPGQDWAFNSKAQGSYKIGDGQLSAAVTQPLSGPEMRPTGNLAYQHNFLKTDNPLQLGAGVTGVITPGQVWSPNANAQGSYKIGDGQLSAGITQSLLPKQQPTYNVDYHHDFYKGKIGEISAGVGVDKTPGKDLDPHATVKASLHF